MIGSSGPPARASIAGRPSLDCSNRPPEVEISTVPATRSANSSGYSSASAMMVMPPIE